jgi:hypothetical protein
VRYAVRPDGEDEGGISSAADACVRYVFADDLELQVVKEISDFDLTSRRQVSLELHSKGSQCLRDAHLFQMEVQTFSQAALRHRLT